MPLQQASKRASKQESKQASRRASPNTRMQLHRSSPRVPTTGLQLRRAGFFALQRRHLKKEGSSTGKDPSFTPQPYRLNKQASEHRQASEQAIKQATKHATRTQMQLQSSGPRAPVTGLQQGSLVYRSPVSEALVPKLWSCIRMLTRLLGPFLVMGPSFSVHHLSP